MNATSSNRSFRNGVTRAVKVPANIRPGVLRARALLGKVILFATATRKNERSLAKRRAVFQTIRMKPLLTALLLAPDAAIAALPPKATDYKGTVVEVTSKAITVQGKIGTRVFPIYPGTIFGKGGKQKFS